VGLVREFLGLLQFLLFKSFEDSCYSVWLFSFLNVLPKKWLFIEEKLVNFLRMSVNGRVSGSNGRLSSSKIKSWKGNESWHVSNSSTTCRWKLFLFWVFGVVVSIGSVWFIFSSFNIKNLSKESACEKSTQTLLQRYNVSRKQLHALASLFSGSDQVTFTFFMILLFNFIG
jgi:hypothetical protein